LLVAAFLGTTLVALSAGAQPREVLVAPASGTDLPPQLILAARAVLVQRMARTYWVVDMDRPPTERPLAPPEAGTLAREMRTPVVVTLHLTRADAVTTITATSVVASSGSVLAVATEGTKQGPEIVPTIVERLADQLSSAIAGAGGLRPPEFFSPTRRLFIGVQAGGSGFVQFVGRVRALGPFHIEAGAFGGSHIMHASMGITLGTRFDERWFPYAGAGVGMGGSFSSPSNCPAEQVGCQEDSRGQILTYGYARAGLGVAYGSGRRHLIAVDLALWRGRHEKTATTSGVTTRQSRPITWVVPGLSYHFML